MNVNMDSFVNKLRNTVSQVAFTVNTSVNTVIPGNAIHREYELLSKRGVYGCPSIQWDIHDAIKKTSSIIPSAISGALSNTHGAAAQQQQSESQHRHDNNNLQAQLYSAFIFDKRQLDRMSKSERDTVVEHLKKSVTQLTRLRHPSLLTVHHPLEESRSTLAFVTEHVHGNVDSILRAQQRNKGESKFNSSSNDNRSLVDLNSNAPIDAVDEANNNSCHLDIVQIKAGLLQVCDGMRFLHHDAKLLHRNLCLDNIFINSNFVWKIAGFDFCATKLQSEMDDRPTFPSLQATLAPRQPKRPNEETCANFPSCVVPNWSYSAPEHSNSNTVSEASDIYSLGLIACVSFNIDKYMDMGYEVGLLTDTYKRGITTREILDDLSPNFRSSLHKFVSLNAGTRPSLDEFSKLAIFEDMQVQTLRCLDATFTWDNMKKVQFYNGLKDILPQLSHQVKVNRVAIALIREFVDPAMIAHVLPNVLLIAKQTTPNEFKTKILPNLLTIFRLIDPPVIPMMLLESLPSFTQRATACMDSFRDSAMSLVFTALQSNNAQLQEQCLTIIPSVKPLLEDASVKSKLLPCLRQVCHGTTVLSIRVKCLVCLGKIIDKLDKWLVTEQVLPLLRDVPSREPAVIMSTVGVLKVIMANPQQKASKEVIATTIIPFLYPLCIEKELNVQQFQSINGLIRDLMKVVEDEQMSLLKKKSTQSIGSGPMDLVNHHITMNAMMSKSPSSNYSTGLSEGASKHIDSLKLLD